jgi:L-fuculose-phosphate aldolase
MVRGFAPKLAGAVSGVQRGAERHGAEWRAQMFERERTQVAEACRRLAEEGLVIGTAGNVSCRAGDEGVAISPTGAALAELAPEHVTVVDLQGEVIAGDLEPTSELDLHLGVYRRYEAGAVVHTHAPMATALSCVIDELPCIHYQMLLLGGPVPVAPYATFGTPELASAVLDALEGHSAALMANHGAIAHAPDMAGAIDRSLLLEWACTVYWRAAAIGSPRVLDEAQRQAVVTAAIERGYGSTRPATRDPEEGG